MHRRVCVRGCFALIVPNTNNPMASVTNDCDRAGTCVWYRALCTLVSVIYVTQVYVVSYQCSYNGIRYSYIQRNAVGRH